MATTATMEDTRCTQFQDLNGRSSSRSQNEKYACDHSPSQRHQQEEEWMKLPIRLHLQNKNNPHDHHYHNDDSQEKIIPSSSFGCCSTPAAAVCSSIEDNDDSSCIIPIAVVSPTSISSSGSITNHALVEKGIAHKFARQSSDESSQDKSIQKNGRSHQINVSFNIANGLLNDHQEQLQSQRWIGRSRKKLPYDIKYNRITNQWVAIISTNDDLNKNDILQDESNGYCKGVVVSSFGSEEEAYEACYAYAPPKLDSRIEAANCHICQKTFFVFRRAYNCENCGVCICLHCSILWPSIMVPSTFRRQKNRLVMRNSKVKVCLACNWLNLQFRKSLLSGDFEEVLELYSFGNINLRSPFANRKFDEILYPVHCAILGGNISALKWLVDQRCCPIHDRKIHNSINPKENKIDTEAILTSRNRSVLSIAMENQSLTIQIYLVLEKKMNIFNYSNLRVTQQNYRNCLEALLEHDLSGSR